MSETPDERLKFVANIETEMEVLRKEFGRIDGELFLVWVHGKSIDGKPAHRCREIVDLHLLARKGNTFITANSVPGEWGKWFPAENFTKPVVGAANVDPFPVTRSLKEAWADAQNALELTEMFVLEVTLNRPLVKDLKEAHYQFTVLVGDNVETTVVNFFVPAYVTS